MTARKLPFALGVLLLPLAVLFTAKEIMDSDLFWHLATGRWIVENGALPHADPFSFVYRDSPWVNLPWIFQLTVYFAYRAFEYAGVLAICGILYAASVFITWMNFLTVARDQEPVSGEVSAHVTKKGRKTRNSRQESTGTAASTGPAAVKPLHLVAFIVFTAACFVLEKRWLPRPEVYTHLLMASFIAVLVRVYQDEKSIRWLVLLPVLQIIWVNAHAMYILGPVLMSFALVSHLLRSGPLLKPSLKPMLITTGAVGLALFVNPYGFKGASYAFYLHQVMRDPLYQTIIEGGPLFSAATPHSLWISAAIWAALLPLSIRPGLRAFGKGYLLLVLFALYFATTMVRNLSPAVLMTLPFIAAGAAEWAARFFASRSSRVDQREEKTRSLQIRPGWQLVAASAVALVPLLGILTDRLRGPQVRHGWSLARTHESVGAAEFFIQNRIDARVFADSDFTNLMLWMKPGFEPYIDSRYAEVVPKSHYIHQGRLLMEPDLIEKEAVDRNLKAAVFIHPLQINRPGAERFSRAPNWRLVYFDHLAAVFFRNDYRPELNLTESQLENSAQAYVEKLKPARPGGRVDPRDLDSISQLLGGLVVLGKNPLALKISEQAQKLAPENATFSEIHCSSGFQSAPQNPSSMEAVQAMTKAEVACRKALEKGDSVSASYYLAMILLNTGRSAESLRHIERVRSANPGDANIHYVYAKALVMAGQGNSRFSEVENALLRAASLTPASGPIWIELGQLHEKAGSLPAAVGYYEKAMKIQSVPGLDQHVTQLKDRVQQLLQAQQPKSGK